MSAWVKSGGGGRAARYAAATSKPGAFPLSASMVPMNVQMITPHMYEVQLPAEQFDAVIASEAKIVSPWPVRPGATIRVISLDGAKNQDRAALAEVTGSTPEHGFHSVSVRLRSEDVPPAEARRPAPSSSAPPNSAWLIVGSERISIEFIQVRESSASMRVEQAIQSGTPGMLYFVGENSRVLVPCEVIGTFGGVTDVAFSAPGPTSEQLITAVRAATPAVIAI